MRVNFPQCSKTKDSPYRNRALRISNKWHPPAKDVAEADAAIATIHTSPRRSGSTALNRHLPLTTAKAAQRKSRGIPSQKSAKRNAGIIARKHAKQMIARRPASEHARTSAKRDVRTTARTTARKHAKARNAKINAKALANERGATLPVRPAPRVHPVLQVPHQILPRLARHPHPPPLHQAVAPARMTANDPRNVGRRRIM